MPPPTDLRRWLEAIQTNWSASLSQTCSNGPDAPSDYDYTDEPWNRPEPCATLHCDNDCDIPSMSAFCYHCRLADLLARANEKARTTDGKDAA